MAEKKKASDYEKYKERSKSSRLDSYGQKCPRNTYLRESPRGKVWYAKITIRGKQFAINSGILERTEGSREKIVAWVEAKRLILQAEQILLPVTTPELPKQPAKPEELIVITRAPSPRSIVAVGDLEMERCKKAFPGSPNLATVEKRLARLCGYFGHETDVSELTTSDLTSYIDWRADSGIAYKTAYRELQVLERAVKKANVRGVFRPAIVLPIDTQERVDLKRLDRVNMAQRSKIFPSDKCEAWLLGAERTRLGPYAFLAYRTGMRSREIECLRAEWIKVLPPDPRKPYAVIEFPQELYREGGHDDMRMGLSKRLYDWLMAAADGKDPSEPIFGNLSSKQRVTKRVQKLIDAPTHITLRDLRASFGSRLSAKTNNPELVQHAMRHKSLQTTSSFYLRVTDESRTLIAEAVDAMW